MGRREDNAKKAVELMKDQKLIRNLGTAAHIDHGEIYAIVHDAIRSYFEHHIMRYDYRHLTVNLTGSVAYHYADVIRDVADEKNIKIGHITATPIEGLTEYHSTNNLI